MKNELKKPYKKLFSKIDKLVYLKVPSFNHIFKWRLLQEKKLKLTSKKKDYEQNLKLKDL